MRQEENALVGALADQGKVRDSNEDRSFYCTFDYMGERRPGVGLLAAVADGMGGHAAGEAASERAIQVLQSRFSGIYSSFDSGRVSDWEGLIKSAIEQANQEVHEEAGRWEGKSGMGTTVTAVALVEGTLYIGHVGDSRAYLIRGESISQLTEDDTWAMEQVKRGLKSREDALASERSNQLMQALGVKESVKVATKAVNLEPGDMVLLCTDGLSGVVPDEEILRTVRRARTPQVASEKLVAAANRQGGPDNIAVLVVQYYPESAERSTRMSRRSVRKTLVAGLAVVLTLLAVDIAYLISQYSEIPKQPQKPARPTRLRPPVSIKVEPVQRETPPPAPPPRHGEGETSVERQRPDSRSDASGQAVSAPKPVPVHDTASGRKGVPRSIRNPKSKIRNPRSEDPGLTMRDMSGEIIDLSGGGGKQ